jgi:spore maturation protein CgeB
LSAPRLRFVFLGLSITSSWGNGHATTYRGLVRELARRGHDVLFLERDLPWYADNRDLPSPPWGRTELYSGVEELADAHARDLRDADVLVVGSFVPDGVAVGTLALDQARGVVAFYDIDTPVTLAALESGSCEYLTRAMVRRYGLYLSFTGGPTLRRIERELGSPAARALYCAAAPEQYRPLPLPPRWDLGYLGTYGADRQPALERFLLEPARRWPEGRFAVAGPQYPEHLTWPDNVDRTMHLSPREHPGFYSAQRFTLNVTRADMVRAGWSPSVRLFEAGACGVPILTDVWEGLDEFFRLGDEVLPVASTEEALAILRGMPEDERRALGERCRERVLAEHTAAHRAEALEGHVLEVAARAAKESGWNT